MAYSDPILAQQGLQAADIFTSIWRAMACHERILSDELVHGLNTGTGALLIALFAFLDDQTRQA
jgi:hypothetical protein